MSTKLVGLLAETFIHPGSEQSVGVIDNPVARESNTGYPFIAGSSMKGALQDRIGEDKTIFGEPDKAGSVLFSDARLLLLPVRSLTSAYKWVTCPLLIERLQRDMKRARLANGDHLSQEAMEIKPKQYRGSKTNNLPLFLEEREFTYANSLPDGCVELFKKFIQDETVQNRLEEQLVLISNDDFTWFSQYALPVQARNVLVEDTKQSKNLWYEEYLPPDTLMYFILADRNPDNGDAEQVQEKLREEPYIQIGGNETVGQGWFSVHFYEGE